MNKQETLEFILNNCDEDLYKFLTNLPNNTTIDDVELSVCPGLSVFEVTVNFKHSQYNEIQRIKNG